jgi:hypothetical protein
MEARRESHRVRVSPRGWNAASMTKRRGTSYINAEEIYYYRMGSSAAELLLTVHSSTNDMYCTGGLDLL